MQPLRKCKPELAEDGGVSGQDRPPPLGSKLLATKLPKQQASKLLGQEAKRGEDHPTQRMVPLHLGISAPCVQSDQDTLHNFTLLSLNVTWRQAPPRL